jgi:hypothetical protein
MDNVRARNGHHNSRAHWHNDSGVSRKAEFTFE